MIRLFFLIHAVFANRFIMNTSHISVETRISLSNCIVESSKRYFSEDFELITYSLPLVDVDNKTSSYFVISHYVLKDLQQQNRWTFLIRNMNAPTYPFKFVAKTTVYIMQIREKGEFANTLKKLKQLLSWNPHAKFLIVSTTNFNNPDEVATEITKNMWSYHILNAAILLSDPEDRTVFNVYSWEPYSNRSCGDNFENTYIDRCSYGTTENNNPWFNDKISADLYNCTIKALYTKWPPFVIANTPTYQHSHLQQQQGIEVNLLNMIAESLNLFVLYQADEEELWGDIYENGTTTGTFISLANDEVDLVIGGYTKSYKKMIHLDCSRAFMQETFIWCVSHEPILLGLKPMIDILPIEGWLGIAMLYFITTLGVWHLSKENNQELRTYKKLANCFSYTFLMLIGFAAKALPISGRSRYFTGFFIMFSLFINILYTTFLTSTLTSKNFKEKYRSMQDIYENKLNTSFLPFTEKYFLPYFEDDDQNYIQDVPIELIQENWKNCNNATVCMKAVLEGKNNALLITELFKEYLFSKFGQLYRSPYKPYCLKKPVLNLPINIIMRKGFPLFYIFKDLMDQIQSAGFISKWEKDILERKKVDIYIDREGLIDYYTIKFSNLVSIFKYLLIGISFAIMVFVIEIVFHRKTK